MLFVAVVGSMAGCATFEPLRRARQTLTMSERALEESHEAPAEQRRAAARQFERLSDAYDLWETGDHGQMAWTIYAPCFAVSLEDLRGTYEGDAAPASIDLAIALLAVSAPGSDCLGVLIHPRVPAPPLPPEDGSGQHTDTDVRARAAP